MKLSELNFTTSILFEETSGNVFKDAKFPLQKAQVIDLGDMYTTEKSGKTFQFSISKDEVYKFNSKADAEKALEEFKKADKSKNKNALDKIKEKYKTQKLGSWASKGFTTQLTWEQVKSRKGVAGLLNNVKFARWMRMLGFFGVSAIMWQSLLINIETLRDQYNEGIEPGTQLPDGTPFEEAVETMYGLWVAQILAVMIAYMASKTRLLSAIKQLRNLIRAGQLGLAATGVGAIPSIVSMLVTEVGFQLAMAALASPWVQRKLAMWVLSYGTDTWASAGLQIIGGTTVAAANAVNAVTGLDFDLLDTLGVRDAAGAGFTKRSYSAEGAKGTAYASSEWAKLVFQDLLFPPGTDAEDLLVPYINKNQRQLLLDELFGSTMQNNMADQQDDETLDAMGDLDIEPVSTPGLPANPDARPGPQ